MRSQKASEYFFIHFANCRIERNELINCCKNVDKYFSFADNYPLWRLIPSIDEILWEKCFNSGRDFKKIQASVHPRIKSGAEKNREYSSEDEISEQLKREREFIEKRMGIKAISDWEAKHGCPIDIVFDSIYNLLNTFFELRDILNKIVSKDKQEILLDIITSHYKRDIRNIDFKFSANSHLEQVPGKISDDNTWDEIGLDDLIYHELADFLSSSEWARLKQCDSCRTFFIAKVRRTDDHSFCCKKCRINYWNRERIKSGQAKEYMRKYRSENFTNPYRM